MSAKDGFCMAHTGLASRSTCSRKLAGKPLGGEYIHLNAQQFFQFKADGANVHQGCLRGGLHHSRSRSLPGTSSPRSAEPNTRMLFTRWLSAISRICVRCSDRASDGRMGAVYGQLQCLFGHSRSLRHGFLMKKCFSACWTGASSYRKQSKACHAGRQQTRRWKISLCFFRSIGTLGLDAGYGHAKSGGQFVRLLCGLGQSLLQCFGREHQTAWLSFCSLCHVAGSVTVSYELIGIRSRLR